jgi:hypothetical protein
MRGHTMVAEVSTRAGVCRPRFSLVGLAAFAFWTNDFGQLWAL